MPRGHGGGFGVKRCRGRTSPFPKTFRERPGRSPAPAVPGSDTLTLSWTLPLWLLLGTGARTLPAPTILGAGGAFSCALTAGTPTPTPGHWEHPPGGLALSLVLVSWFPRPVLLIAEMTGPCPSVQTHLQVLWLPSFPSPLSSLLCVCFTCQCPVSTLTPEAVKSPDAASSPSPPYGIMEAVSVIDYP